MHTIDVPLYQLNLASHKRDSDKPDPDQTPYNAAADQGIHCALPAGISVKHGNNKTNQTPLISGPKGESRRKSHSA